MPKLPDEPPVTPRDFRSVLGRFASGVTIVTTQVDEQVHGMTANAFASVSLDPPLVLVSVDNRSNMHSLLSLSGRYGVSILAEGQDYLSNHFAGRPIKGLDEPFVTKYKMPLIEGALGYLIAKVIATHVAGDHTLYVGEVEFLESQDGEPLLFYDGKYYELSEEEAVPGPYAEDDFSLFSLGRNPRRSRDSDKTDAP